MNSKVPLPSYEEQQAFIETVKSIFPSSALLNVTTFKIGPQSNIGTARTLPPTVMSLESFTGEDKYIFQHLTLNKGQAEYLAEATKEQSNSMLWFTHRKG